MRKVVAVSAAMLLLVGLMGLAPALRGGASSRATRHEVTIKNLRFQPLILTASPGDTIVWHNVDIVPHTATADDQGWDSGNLPNNGTWKLVIGARGQLRYHCRYHPEMQATISVE